MAIGAHEVVIGRAPECDIVLESAGISNEHAMLDFRNGEYVLTDTSMNGTYINSEPMEGSVQGAGAVACSNKTPSAASSSITGVSPALLP